MPKDYNTLFRQDPLAFMQKYSVVPDDDTGSTGGYVGDLNQQGKKVKTKNDYEYKTMANNQLIAYLDFVKVPHNPGQAAPQRTGQIMVRGDYTVNPAKVAAYFLPWLNNNIISLTIPQMPQFGGGPRYFFTAAISGCSIFIKGTEQSPTIYHAGGTTGRPKPKAGAKFWRDMMQTHNATMGPNVAEVNKTMYVTDKKDKAEGTANSRKFREWLKGNVGGQFLIEDVAPTGCVMGVRTGGLWKFYLQENATITYSQFNRVPVNRSFQNVKVVGTTNVAMRPMLFRQIFPGGTAHVKLVPDLSRLLKV